MVVLDCVWWFSGLFAFWVGGRLTTGDLAFMVGGSLVYIWDFLDRLTFGWRNIYSCLTSRFGVLWLVVCSVLFCSVFGGFCLFVSGFGWLVLVVGLVGLVVWAEF